MATDLNYLKRAILTLALSADERDAPDLGAQFYSYDKQSGKFIIRLIDEEDQPINLSQFAVINIVMAPNRDISKGRTIVPMQSEDPEDGVVSVILPDNIRQFNGTIIAGVVAMNADNIKTHDFGYFRFEMKQSLIDANIENLSDFYVDEFEQLREQIHQIMQDILDDIDAFKLDITNQLNTLVTRINTIRKDIDQLFADLKNFKLFKAYKMADGTFSKRLPPVNLFSPRYLVSQSFADVEATKTGFIKKTTVTTTGWTTGIMANAELIKLLKPNTQYSIYYEYKILTRDTQGVKYINDQMGTLLIYSGVSGYNNISLSSSGQGLIAEMKDKKVGDIVKRNATFTTPANFADANANYRMLFYTMRGVNDQNVQVLNESGEFRNIKISTGDDTVIFTTNPDDDIVNAYPKWHGLGLQSSDNPDDYQWDLAVNYSENRDDRFALANGRLKVLPNTVDLNTLTETANYLVAGSPNSPANEPNSSILQVFNGGSDKMVVQFFTAMGSNKTYYRTCHVNFDWFQWKLLDTTMDTGFVELKNAQDFNNLKATQVVANTNATIALHAPVNGSFIVEVTQHNAAYTVQRATLLTAANQVYHRQLMGGTWSPWYKYDMTPAVGSVSQVPDGTDLNTKTMSGTFWGSTLTNAPIAGNGIIYYVEVLSTNGTADCMQVATMRSMQDRTFTRQRINNAWTSWIEIPKQNLNGYIPTLTSGTDLNTKKTTDSFLVWKPANAPAVGGEPTFYIEIVSYKQDYCYQRATMVSSNRVFTRQSTTSGGVIVWSAWTEVLSASSGVALTGNQTIAGLKNFTTRPTVGGVQVMLTINSVVTGTANWDSYKDIGTYYFNGVTNSPKYMSNYGYLEVMSAPNTNGVIQRYTDLDGNCIMRTQKTLSAGVIGWTPWKVVRLELPYTELTFASGWRNYATESTAWGYAAVSRSGDVCQLLGVVSNTVNFTPSNAQVPMAYVPEGYRPKVSTYGTIKRSSGRTMYTCEVTTEGTVTNSAMVDPGVNGYASTQSPGKLFHIGLTYIGEDIAFF